MDIIQQSLETFLSDPESTLARNGSFTADDFNRLRKVLNGTTEDFLIFDNGGGKKFDIMFDREYFNEDGQIQVHKIKNFILYLLREHRAWIYCYQLAGVQTILKKF
jgi:hypothetical protein